MRYFPYFLFLWLIQRIPSVFSIIVFSRHAMQYCILFLFKFKGEIVGNANSSKVNEIYNNITIYFSVSAISRPFSFLSFWNDIFTVEFFSIYLFCKKFIKFFTSFCISFSGRKTIWYDNAYCIYLHFVLSFSYSLQLRRWKKKYHLIENSHFMHMHLYTANYRLK